MGQYLIARDPSMNAAYRSLDVERIGDVCLASFRDSSLDDWWAQQLGDELHRLIEVEGCRKLVISFARCDALYSVLLGKLMTARRQMQALGGRLKLLDVTPLVHDVFKTCKLEGYFEFAADRESALNDW